jgi:hypothetical protein
MSSWYVAYRGGSATVWSIAGSRDEATSIACGMCSRGIDVEEIGPLYDTSDGEIIGSGEIHAMDAIRVHDPVGSR